MLAVALLGSACGDAPAPPAMPSESPASPAAQGPLRLLDVKPAPGDVKPRAQFRLRFDRPVAPGTINNINCYYPDPGAVLLADPFRLTASWVEDDAATVLVQPPPLLTGRVVRLVVRDGLRGADGSSLPPEPGLPPGIARIFEYRVLELPPP